MSRRLIEWPLFETVRSDLPLESDATESVPRNLKVPKGFMGKRYAATDHLRIVSAPERGLLVQFGTVMIYSTICVDPKSGEVVSFLERPGQVPRYVSSSLGAFSRTVEDVVEHFPFYGQEAELEDWKRVAAGIARVIAQGCNYQQIRGRTGIYHHGKA